MNSVINIGFLNINIYSIILFFAMMIGIYISTKEAKKLEIDDAFFTDLIFYTIIFGILGARIYFVIFNFNYYINNPLNVIKIWEGGLAIHGGIIAGLIFICFYCKKNNVSIFKILDILAPSLLLAQAIGRWGNFFNKEAHGPEVDFDFFSNFYIPDFIADGMYINGAYYLPTFLFESFFCLLGFILMMILKNRNKLKLGQITSIYLIIYGTIRIFIEYFRTDSLMLFSFKMAQIISIIMIVLGLLIYIKSKNHTECKEDLNV